MEITQDFPTPPLLLQDLQDRSHTLADYRGKVVLVNFWASWCPPCIYEMPGLVRLEQRLADEPFEILAVNVGEKKYKVWKFLKLINFDLPVLLDVSSEAFDAWGVKTLPTTFLLDASGRIRYRILGDPEWDDADTVAVVEKLLAETAQEQPNRTPPSEVTDN
jgi:thiol-disulfide isomerase/thioredoxin